MEIESTVEIAAPVELVWKVLIDIERWPEWTASIKSAQRLGNESFGLGSRALVRQPRLPAAVWRVTQFVPGHGFVWENHAVGARTIGEHWIEPLAGGRSRAISRIRQTGFMAAILRPLISGLTRQYVDMETRGLKQRCEETFTV